MERCEKKPSLNMIYSENSWLMPSLQSVRLKTSLFYFPTQSNFVICLTCFCIPDKLEMMMSNWVSLWGCPFKAEATSNWKVSLFFPFKSYQPTFESRYHYTFIFNMKQKYENNHRFKATSNWKVSLSPQILRQIQFQLYITKSKAQLQISSYIWLEIITLTLQVLSAHLWKPIKIHLDLKQYLPKKSHSALTSSLKSYQIIVESLSLKISLLWFISLAFILKDQYFTSPGKN